MDSNHCRTSSIYRYQLRPLRTRYGSEHHCLRAILTIRQSSVVLNRSLSTLSQNQSSTTPNANRSPLLRLPRELRDLIYEYSLLTIHVSYHHFSPGYNTDGSMDRFFHENGFVILSPEPHDPQNSRPLFMITRYDAALLSVCRQIHAEASPIQNSMAQRGLWPFLDYECDIWWYDYEYSEDDA